MPSTCVEVKLRGWAQRRERVEQGHAEAARRRLALTEMQHRLTSVNTIDGSLRWTRQYASLYERVALELEDLAVRRPRSRICPLCNEVFVPLRSGQSICGNQIWDALSRRLVRRCTPLEERAVYSGAEAAEYRKRRKTRWAAMNRARKKYGHGDARTKRAIKKWEQWRDENPSPRPRGRPPKPAPATSRLTALQTIPTPIPARQPLERGDRTPLPPVTVVDPVEKPKPLARVYKGQAQNPRARLEADPIDATHGYVGAGISASGRFEGAEPDKRFRVLNGSTWRKPTLDESQVSYQHQKRVAKIQDELLAGGALDETTMKFTTDHVFDNRSQAVIVVAVRASTQVATTGNGSSRSGRARATSCARGFHRSAAVDHPSTVPEQARSPTQRNARFPLLSLPDRRRSPTRRRGTGEP